MYTSDYRPENTVTVSLGTGRYESRKRPGWIGSWLKWVLGELLDSPGEQQTEIARRQFPQMAFYRIDPRLEEDIGLDDIGRIDRLREYGERTAESTDWEAILSGTDETFRIDGHRTLRHQYMVSA